MEDPSDEFRALRDFVDCRNALAIECFRTPAVHEDFGGELERACQEKLKLHKVRVGDLSQHPECESHPNVDELMTYCVQWMKYSNRCDVVATVPSIIGGCRLRSCTCTLSFQKINKDDCHTIHK